MRRPTNFYTLGYEKSDIETFLSRLREHSVSLVADVRALPLSRKKGFSKKGLEARLAGEGIGYMHAAALGAPKALREKRRAGCSWADYAAGYEKLVLSLRKQEVKALADLALRERISLLCFERDPGECHRSLLADEMLKQAGAGALTVVHIRY
jgi:uncharacterized protein (DUF488 family)